MNIGPLTPGRGDDLADLFGRQGACFGCWCAYFRLGPAARNSPGGAARREVFGARVLAGPPPGLLGHADGRPIGWMQVGPRADVPEGNGARRASAPLPDGPASDPRVWAISCLFLRRGARGRGLTHALVAAGIAEARAAGARLLEACPVVVSSDRSGMGRFVGAARVFARAGFAVVAERRAGRPLVRPAL